MNHEDAARLRKAQTLAEYIRSQDLNPAILVHQDGDLAQTDALRQELRRALCGAAGVNPASEQTWAVVVGLLGADREMSPAMRAALPDDPFDGLDG